MFVVASASVGSVSLSLLEHQEQQAGWGAETKEGEECAAEDEEPESISVPVHGLGTVNVLSAPVSARYGRNTCTTQSTTSRLIFHTKAGKHLKLC